MNRSLIQPGEISIFGEMKTCQVHDMILDFLVSKAVEENFTTIIGVHNVAHEPEKKVRRLSPQDKSADDAIREEDSSQHIVLENKNIYHPFLPLRLINRPIPDLKIPEDLIVSHVRSLTLFGTVRDLHPFQRCRLLRVLDLHNCIILSRDYLIDFGYLIFLKYFSIKGTVVDVIPNNISELQNLETLNITNVKGCYKIPATMVQLGRLVTLHVERELPDGIGGMKALQVLKKVNVFKQTTNFVQEIGQLTNLRSLHITVATVFSRYAENKEENMKMMVSAICNLGRYDLHSIRIDITDELDIEFFQESWWHSPPISLHKLVVKLAKISRVPRWMGSLVNLHKLFFPMKEVRQADLVILGGLPALLYLFLPVEGRVSAGPAGGRVRISGSHGFPSLRLFQIGGDVCALGLVFDVRCMPKLQRLEFEFNAWETNHLTIGCFSFGIEQLSSLTSAFCRIVYVGATNDTFQQVEAALEEARSTHPNNPRFTRCSHPTRSQMIKKARKEEKRQVHELTESEEEEYEGSDYKKYLKLIKFQYNG
ncbi:hypothetical protein QOZ80_8AG0628010 [Eleusine coracana subsp. coracana]|nr:hypothetical protein QOZ80_8AG0628010 [Eleusine coracana subsp. coracana]